MKEVLAGHTVGGIVSGIVGALAMAVIAGVIVQNVPTRGQPPEPSPSVTATQSTQARPSSLVALTAPPAFITVPGSAEAGVRLGIAETGTYEILILSGAYSSWPTDSGTATPWRSILAIYVNRPIAWGLRPGLTQPEPVDPDHWLGLWQDLWGHSEQEMDEHSRGRLVVATLSAGDSLLFVPIDSRSAYNDNRGAIQLRIARTG